MSDDVRLVSAAHGDDHLLPRLLDDADGVVDVARRPLVDAEDLVILPQSRSDKERCLFLSYKKQTDSPKCSKLRQNTKKK